MDLGKLVLWFLIGYLIVSIIGIVHVIFNCLVLKMDSRKDESVFDMQAFSKTLPFHLVYNILVWPIIGYMYLQTINPNDIWLYAAFLGVVWCLYAIILDFLSWVIIKHRWHMTAKELYMDYQPWLSIIYIIIFISPFIAVLLN